MFYVLAATRARLRDAGRLAGNGPNLATLLDLVALGTVADVVRLDQVNRILVEQGLRRMRAARSSRVSPRSSTSPAATRRSDRFRPRVRRGAAPQCCRAPRGHVGRHPLPSRRGRHDRTRARKRARRAQPRATRRRGDNARGGARNARREEFEASDACTLCLFRDSWHQGVVGIVASRLKDRFNRPAIVFARGSSGELKGSGRSIAGFHLRDALDVVSKREPGLIARFGGHAFAAGVSIREADLTRFAAAFESVARERLSAADLARVVETDGALASDELTFALAERLRDPVWGQGFPAPSFDDEFDVVATRIVGDTHTRLLLKRGDERIPAVLFRSTATLPPRWYPGGVPARAGPVRWPRSYCSSCCCIREPGLTGRVGPTFDSQDPDGSQLALVRRTKTG